MVSSLRRRALWLCLFTVALALGACQPPKVTNPKDPAFVVAETKDWKITRAELDHKIAESLQEHGVSPAQIGSHMPEVETYVLREMVVEKLLLEKAGAKNYQGLDKLEKDAFAEVKGNFPSEKDYQDKLKATGTTEEQLKQQIHDHVLMNKYMQAEVLKDIDPTDKEINDFYLANQNAFQRPLMLRASSILVRVDEKATPAQKAAAKKKIEAARARVAKGEPFSVVAKEVSDDKYTGPKGGDTGYFQQGVNEPEFDKVAFASKVGEQSKVFESPAGYEFLEVTEIKPAGVASVDEERPRIADHLRQLKARKEGGDYVSQLLKDSNVKFNIPMVEPTAEPAPAANGAPPAGEPTPAPEPSAPPAH